jgi:DNA-binding LytR/AlgR family response regulator
VWAIFRAPYPADSSPRSDLLYGLACGLFVYVFFAVFEPFGFNMLPSPLRRWIFAGYSLVTAGAIVFNGLVLPRLAPRFFREEKWSTGRQILFMFWVTLVIGLGSYLLTISVFRGRGLLPPPLPQVILFTFFIAVFPITFINLANYARLLRRNARVVLEANRQLATPASRPLPVGKKIPPDVELIAENNRDSLRIAWADLLYIKAEENYVQVHHKGEKPGRVLLRSSLTRIERQLRPFSPHFFRCHRTCIVNTSQIAKVDGNAQGLRLTLKDTPDTVPVARRYVAEFRRLVQGL